MTPSTKPLASEADILTAALAALTERLPSDWKADLKREGKDVTLITWSRMYYFCQQAAQELEKEGISAEILDLRTLRPLDEEAIVASVKKTNRAVVVEEGWPHSGVGAQVVDLIQSRAFDWLDAPVVRVTGLDLLELAVCCRDRLVSGCPVTQGGMSEGFTHGQHRQDAWRSAEG